MNPMKTTHVLAAALAAPVAVTGFAVSPASGAQTSAPAAVVAAGEDERRSVIASRNSRSAGASMRHRGTRHSPRMAAKRLERWAERGVGGYHNQCLRLADNAYQPKHGRTSTALNQWSRAKRKGFAHPGDRRPPVGAQMFWRTSNPAGHIATYVGGGKAVTNVPGGRVKKMNWERMNSWGRYLGWAEPYYG
jgi:hypothetical protein